MSSSGSSRLDAAGSLMYERLGSYAVLAPAITVAVGVKAAEVVAGVEVPTLLAIVLFVVALVAGLVGQWRYDNSDAPHDAEADVPDAELEQSR